MGDDDSSAEEDMAGEEAVTLEVLQGLAQAGAAEARELHSTCLGARVYVKELRGVKDRVVRVGRGFALELSHGVDPGSCVALQNGRLAPLGPGAEFQLQRAHAQDGWLLAADSRAFYNFALRRWQPIGLAVCGPYAPVLELLYVAFTPDRGPTTGAPALFVKLGYHELVEAERGDHNAMIGYVEGKSAKLQITNRCGAGVFVFAPPEGHRAFARPCRAAEVSLKTELLHSAGIVATPSGHVGDIGAFSSSLEYFFVEGVAGTSPLTALTRLLRRFSGDPELQPKCAEASAGGGLRRGKKRLAPWPEELPGGSEPEAPGPGPPRAQPGLCTRAKRAKLGAAARGVARRSSERAARNLREAREARSAELPAGSAKLGAERAAHGRPASCPAACFAGR